VVRVLSALLFVTFGLGPASACATDAANAGVELDALARALQVAAHQLQKARIDSSLDVRTSLEVPASGALVVVAPSAAVDVDRAGAVAPALAGALGRQTAWPGRHFLGVVSSERVQSLDLQGLGISRQLQAYLAPGTRELTVTLRSLRGEVYVSALR
jgi:hypothetical protein